jgi:hypothetical protein
VWRIVEAQHRVSTLKLVDSLAEQAALEEILEVTKPPLPEECRHLDYLPYCLMEKCSQDRGCRLT